jgi:hypothetical protein
VRPLPLVILAGCSVTPSDEVETGRLWARIQAAQHGTDTVAVQAMLTVGGPTGTVVDLVGEDHMEVEGVEMTEWTDSVTDYHWNRAVIDATPDAMYQVTLVRADAVIPTVVTVPSEPLITGTEPSGAVGWNEPLTITWDTSEPGDGVEVRIEGDCVMGLAVSQVPDTGSYTTAPLQDGGQLADCEITARVIRGLTRPVSSAYEGGWAESFRSDSTTIFYDSLGG